MSPVQNNLEMSQYETYLEGHLAGIVQYRMENQQLWLMSTEMMPLIEGHATASDFLREVLQDLHRRRIAVLPFCPVAREFMLGNRVFLSLVPKDPPGHFPLMHESVALPPERKTSAAGATKGSTTDGGTQNVSEHLGMHTPPKRTFQRQSQVSIIAAVPPAA